MEECESLVQMGTGKKRKIRRGTKREDVVRGLVMNGISFPGLHLFEYFVST